ncbi:hypothetical protein OF117_15780 [Geodermatophilus sp. YIM 151500]|uniref:hypothetical protein n=1 Tax=Geodermatophilus sp. YIM 151500 TaxID=2984531 RepID=UPI0021E40208|nr:hypothetical protein [Geodermatophilus sp. YIM 151500]MCV2490816.1 hypothetical protein [Geodermatophilus sp. YIM 151500]
MKRLARAAVLSALADGLHERNSWTGETHLQKATFFLQEALGVPFEYDFILYKHGPFSFALRDELNSLEADRFIEVKPQRYPYGPRLETTHIGKALQAKFPRTMEMHRAAVDQVADFVRDRGVGELERLGTALLLIKENPNAHDEKLAELMTGIKPHVSLPEALTAVGEVRSFMSERHGAAV